jgi:hypothetical protein
VSFIEGAQLTYFLAASILLVAGGVAKLRHPSPAVNALRDAGLPARRQAVRLLAASEVIVGSAAVAAPRPWIALGVGLFYLCFTAFVVRLLASGARGLSCGCAGEQEIPPSWLHVVLNAFAATSAVAVALNHEGVTGAIATVGRGAPVFILGSIAVAWAAYLAVAFSPALFSAYGSNAAR